jgi:hypothetical protein
MLQSLSFLGGQAMLGFCVHHGQVTGDHQVVFFVELRGEAVVHVPA